MEDVPDIKEEIREEILTKLDEIFQLVRKI